MKDKKIIAYRTRRVKRIAFNLRILIQEAVMGELSRLRRVQVKNKSQAERIRIENERSDLYRALQASICECSSCRQTDKDMVYNASLESWYCPECVQEYRKFYYKNKAVLDRGGFVGDFNEYFHSTFL